MPIAPRKPTQVKPLLQQKAPKLASISTPKISKQSSSSSLLPKTDSISTPSSSGVSGNAIENTPTVQESVANSVNVADSIAPADSTITSTATSTPTIATADIIADTTPGNNTKDVGDKYTDPGVNNSVTDYDANEIITSGSGSSISVGELRDQANGLDADGIVQTFVLDGGYSFTDIASGLGVSDSDIATSLSTDFIYSTFNSGDYSNMSDDEKFDIFTSIGGTPEQYDSAMGTNYSNTSTDTTTLSIADQMANAFNNGTLDTWAADNNYTGVYNGISYEDGVQVSNAVADTPSDVPTDTTTEIDRTVTPTGEYDAANWYTIFGVDSPDSDGLDYWQNRLNSGEDPDTIWNEFSSFFPDANADTNTDTTTTTTTTGGDATDALSLYSQYGITNPDQAGIDYWQGRLDSGEDPDTVAAEFASFFPSGDYTMNSSDPNDWYKNQLGVEGDSEGIAYWTNRIAEIGEEAAFKEFMLTSEQLLSDSEFDNSAGAEIGTIYDSGAYGDAYNDYFVAGQYQGLTHPGEFTGNTWQEYEEYQKALAAYEADQALKPSALDNVTGSVTTTSSGTTSNTTTSSGSDVATYEPTDANAVTYTVDEDATVAGQLNSLLDSSSEYMRSAETAALQDMEARGLLNSSVATTAAEAARLDKAYEIAEADADTYEQQALTNQQYENEVNALNATASNEASQFNAGSENNALLQDDAQGHDLTMQDDAQGHDLTMQNDAQDHELTALGLEGEIQMSINDAQLAMQEKLALLESETTLSVTEMENASKEAIAAIDSMTKITLEELDASNAYELEALESSFDIEQNLDTVLGKNYTQLISDIGDILSDPNIGEDDAAGRISVLIENFNVINSYSMALDDGTVTSGELLDLLNESTTIDPTVDPDGYAMEVYNYAASNGVTIDQIADAFNMDNDETEQWKQWITDQGLAELDGSNIPITTEATGEQNYHGYYIDNNTGEILYVQMDKYGNPLQDENGNYLEVDPDE